MGRPHTGCSVHSGQSRTVVPIPADLQFTVKIAPALNWLEWILCGFHPDLAKAGATYGAETDWLKQMLGCCSPDEFDTPVYSMHA